VKIPFVMLRRFEWRLGLRARSLRVPGGMSRSEFEAALESLPPDVDAEELLEFIEAGELEAPGQAACPVFRERLRRLLWGMVGRGQAMPVRVGRHLN
jgi:inorganic triphosphatase YgiF